MPFSRSDATTLPFPPDLAWEPLPGAEWNGEAARHLLRRAGWTARPEDVERATREGLAATLERLFPPVPAFFPKPELTADVEREWPDYQRRQAAASPEEQRSIRRELRERSQAALLDMSLRWLEYAADPGNCAFAKWTLFLSDIYVVSFEKVPRTPLLFEHFDIIARRALGPAPDLSKAVSRSPAMVVYLDLNESRRDAPNENFARELFELFILGEGNYSERDIKEAAQAFTGYRLRPPGARFVFAPNQHDWGVKTVFGESGRFSGDDVIDLAYRLPAAGAFVPHELVKFYLSDAMLPKEHLYALGNLWRAAGYDLRWLALRFFGSQTFFAPEFRGQFIKSPVQFYLGLVRDLSLNVAPFPRYSLAPLRRMGQVLFNPPNVRGWVGGRNWINSSTLAARRAAAEMLFAPMAEEDLNAEERRDLAEARARGAGDFVVPGGRFAHYAALDAAAEARRLSDDVLGAVQPPDFYAALASYLAAAAPGTPERLRRTKRAAITLVESPRYQLC